jgi:hypothetical protein
MDELSHRRAVKKTREDTAVAELLGFTPEQIQESLSQFLVGAYNAGHYYDGPRYTFEVEAFCCDDMHRAWDAGIVAMDDTPAVALGEMHVDREANPRMVRYGGVFYPIQFCPFCGRAVEATEAEAAG